MKYEGVTFVSEFETVGIVDEFEASAEKRIDEGAVKGISWASVPSFDFGEFLTGDFVCDDRRISLRDIRDLYDEFYFDGYGVADVVNEETQQNEEFLSWCSRAWRERGLREDERVRLAFRYRMRRV